VFLDSRYAANKLTGALQNVKDQIYNYLPGMTIACDDTYMTESTVDQNGNQLPPGVYQLVS
jgi:hypothetical protein